MPVWKDDKATNIRASWDMLYSLSMGILLIGESGNWWPYHTLWFYKKKLWFFELLYFQTKAFWFLLFFFFLEFAVKQGFVGAHCLFIMKRDRSRGSSLSLESHHQSLLLKFHNQKSSVDWELWMWAWRRNRNQACPSLKT